MANIMEQLEALSNKDWQNLFSAIEEDSRRRVASLKEDCSIDTLERLIVQQKCIKISQL